jgi:hypothetical protein
MSHNHEGGDLPNTHDYLGVFFVAFSTLMFELLLTRLFSVVMWYHFAFVAISAALFGMTIGAIGVYLNREKLRQIGERKVMAQWSLYSGLSMIAGLLVFVAVPIVPTPFYGTIATAVIVLSALSIPFIASGVVLALALTHFSARVGSVYAIDLLGAATGCFAVIFALRISDGSTAVFAAALVALFGSLAFAHRQPEIKRLARIGIAGTLILISISLFAIASGEHPFRLIWGKSILEPSSISEEWNTFSRVSVYPREDRSPFGWGLSDKCDAMREVEQLYLNIDGDAGTILTKFDGDTSKFGYLACDITNLVHHLIHGADVFIVGSGGGRDVLSALSFNALSVTAVELNDEILRAVNETFGDFTGHLDKDPRVTFANDEARSYLTRDDSRYDIIQVSLIDTWAATAAGAFALSENALYTEEAWTLFMNRLTERGMLSVSRWYHGKFPAESYRTAALAVAALKNIGVEDPASHIALVTATPKQYKRGTDHYGISTIIVSKNPMDIVNVTDIVQVSMKYDFEIQAAPHVPPSDEILATILSGDMKKASTMINANINAPTDEQPFFFNFIRPIDLITPANWKYHNLKSLGLLATMALVVLVFIAMVLMVPSRLKRVTLSKGAMTLAAYFLGIGIGFMAVEIGLLQRLSIFFGHPSYALLVALPTILVASGLGSMASDSRMLQRIPARTKILILVVAISAVVNFLPWLVENGSAWENHVRVLVAVGLLFPLGFLMGMPFATGMRLASKHEEKLTPWLWGLNGVASVAASVLAVLLSLVGGITFAFLLGIAGYLVTAFAAGKIDKKQ